MDGDKLHLKLNTFTIEGDKIVLNHKKANWMFNQDEQKEANLALALAELSEKTDVSKTDLIHIFPMVLRMMKSDSIWAENKFNISYIGDVKGHWQEQETCPRCGGGKIFEIIEGHTMECSDCMEVFSKSIFIPIVPTEKS